MIYAIGNMKTRELLKAGLGIKVIGIGVIFIASLLLVSPVFHIQDPTSPLNTTLMTNATDGWFSGLYSEDEIGVSRPK